MALITVGYCLPLAGVGAGDGAGVALPTAALLLPIWTLQARGGAGQANYVLVTACRHYFWDSLYFYIVYQAPGTLYKNTVCPKNNVSKQNATIGGL